MCPGISYSTVHSLIFHNNGSVQENKLFTEVCNRNQATFSYENAVFGIQDYMIDNVTLTLMDQPQEEKYDDSHSSIHDYQIMTTFIKINNISATWEKWDWWHPTMASESNGFNLTYQIRVGSYWCMKGLMFDCGPSQ